MHFPNLFGAIFLHNTKKQTTRTRKIDHVQAQNREKRTHALFCRVFYLLRGRTQGSITTSSVCTLYATYTYD